MPGIPADDFSQIYICNIWDIIKFNSRFWTPRKQEHLFPPGAPTNDNYSRIGLKIFKVPKSHGIPGKYPIFPVPQAADWRNLHQGQDFAASASKLDPSFIPGRAGSREISSGITLDK